MSFRCCSTLAKNKIIRKEAFRGEIIICMANLSWLFNTYNRQLIDIYEHLWEFLNASIVHTNTHTPSIFIQIILRIQDINL